MRVQLTNDLHSNQNFCQFLTIGSALLMKIAAINAIPDPCVCVPHNHRNTYPVTYTICIAYSYAKRSWLLCGSPTMPACIVCEYRRRRRKREEALADMLYCIRKLCHAHAYISTVFYCRYIQTCKTAAYYFFCFLTTMTF